MNKTGPILVIEDDTDDQEHLVQLIHEIDADIKCFMAVNGQEGLHKLQTASIPVPSLIFLDLNMPRIDGKRFLFEIKKDPDHKHIPVIIYTTSSYEKDKEETRRLGAAGYITKTSDFETLKSVLIGLLKPILCH